MTLASLFVGSDLRRLGQRFLWAPLPFFVRVWNLDSSTTFWSDKIARSSSNDRSWGTSRITPLRPVMDFGSWQLTFRPSISSRASSSKCYFTFDVMTKRSPPLSNDDSFGSPILASRARLKDASSDFDIALKLTLPFTDLLVGYFGWRLIAVRTLLRGTLTKTAKKSILIYTNKRMQPQIPLAGACVKSSAHWPSGPHVMPSRCQNNNQYGRWGPRGLFWPAVSSSMLRMSQYFWAFFLYKKVENKSNITNLY